MISVAPLRKFPFLNANALKILAALLMLIDHIGAIFYPTSHFLFRKIGRLSFPVFAFFISEGCRYTKNKSRHFSLLAGLAVLCEIVVRIAVPNTPMASILITFSFSVLIIYALQAFKKRLFENAPVAETVFFFFVFASGVGLAFWLCYLTPIDYGFWGVMTPVFVSLFDFRGVPAPAFLQKLDCLPVRVLSLLPCLFMLVETSLLPALQWYAFLALPLLLCYNGERGTWNMKYFFYVFYPLHLAFLYGVYYFFVL